MLFGGPYVYVQKDQLKVTLVSLKIYFRTNKILL